MRIGRILRIASLMMVLFLLGGCGKPLSDLNESGAEADWNEPGAVEEEDVVEEPQIDRSGFDWHRDEWARPKTTKGKEHLNIRNFSVGSINYGEATGTRVIPYIDCCTRYDDFFVLDLREASGGEDLNYFVDRYHAEQGTCTSAEISAEAMTGELTEGQYVNIENFDVMNEDEYVFLVELYSDGELKGLEAVHTDAVGGIRKTVDLYPAFVESGIYPVDDLDVGKNHIGLDFLIDKDGFYYLESTRVKNLAVVNGEGQLCTTVVPEENWQQDYGYVDNKLCKDPDGGVILFSYYEKRNRSNSENQEKGEDKSAAYRFDPEKGIMQKMGNTGTYIKRYCMTEDGFGFLISSDDDLYRWDLYTGALTTVLNLKTEGITENPGMVMITVDNKGEIFLYVMRASIEMYSLTWEKPAEGENLKIMSLTTDCKELKAAAADYSRRHPANAILVDGDVEDVDDRRTRLMADLVSGKGPAAMYVSRADMEILYEKGLLSDLTGLLSRETEEQIFSGVLECGKVDGEQIGFPMTAELSTILVRDDVWSGDDWSVEDVVNLVKSGKYPQLETIIGIAGGVSRCGFGGLGILQALVLENIENSPFLDMENRECSFDSPEFIELLELIAKYENINYIDSPGEQLGEGKILGYMGDVRNIEKFSTTMSELGEDYHCVGFPTEGGSGSFWNCDYYLVVNKDADCLDTIRGLMEYLYSYNRQIKNEAPLRRDVYRTKVGEGRNDGYVSLHCGDMVFRLLRAKPDGSSWLGEFLELADKAVPCSKTAEEITEIIREEAGAFFEGDKDATSVAQVIQSRVWIYLNE